MTTFLGCSGFLSAAVIRILLHPPLSLKSFITGRCFSLRFLFHFCLASFRGVKSQRRGALEGDSILQMDDSAKHSLLLVADRRGGPRFLHQRLSNSVRPVLLSTGIRSGLSPSCYKCHFIMAGRPQSIWNFNAARAQHRRATQRIS